MHAFESSYDLLMLYKQKLQSKGGVRGLRKKKIIVGKDWMSQNLYKKMGGHGKMGISLDGYNTGNRKQEVSSKD